MDWKNVFLGIVIVLLALYLPTILSTVASVVSDFGDAMRTAWSAGARGYHHSGDPLTSVVQLAVLGIIAVGIFKFLKRK